MGGGLSGRLARAEGSAFTVPLGMVQALVDPQTGELATEWCPGRAKQWFKPGREPQEMCHLHTGPPQGQIAIGQNGNVQGPRSDPIAAIGRGIGSILRKIIHW